MARIIGIAGGSASGKSTLTEKLESRLTERGLRVKSVHMDWFFKPSEKMPRAVSHVSGREYEDHNVPETVDWDGFHAAFDEAAAGEYDAVIAEGLLTLWDEYILNRLDIKVFVECRADERIVRRIKRNMKWGNQFDDIVDVYLDMVRFRHDQYVEPTKWIADVIVNGTGNTDMVCDMLIGQLTE